MLWPLLKAVVVVEIWISNSFCKAVGFMCASLRCHISISDGDSCRLIIGGSPRLFRFIRFEEVGGVGIAAGAAVTAISIIYRLFAKWPEMVMLEKGEEIRLLPWPKVDIKPAVSSELMERRELRKEGV